MQKTFLTMLLIVTICSAFKCNKEDENIACSSGPLVIKSLETEYGCINTPMQMNISLSNTYRLINSQAEFANLVTGSCLPTIDFAQYTLLIGKQTLNGGLSNISYEANKDCSTGGYVVNVTITKNLALQAPNVTYHLLLPKIQNSSLVQVNTMVH
jgi:hypothetical protein